MWIGDKIYFVSDRDGTLNLYSFDINSGDLDQLTKSNTWDVRWASSDNKSRIVYEFDGELRVYDLEANQEKKISITVPNDGLAMRPSRYSAANNIEDVQLSPKGERALIVARGDIFTVPVEKGPTRNLTNSSNAHDKWARWSPDGSKIAFVSDMSGEEQIYLINQDGSGKPEQLTTQFKAMLYAPDWSPDGKRLAFSDKDGKLYVLEVATKAVQEVADDEFGRIFDYRWSPDGGHLAFSMGNWNDFNSLYIWSAADRQTRRITGELFNAYGPAWDAEGNFLYYFSDREFAPQISNIEWNYAGNRRTGIFAMALRKDVKHPFAPESDEVTIGQEADKKKDEKEETKSPVNVAIDFDGLEERAARVPVEANNYGNLRAVKGQLFYVQRGASFYGRDSYEKPSIQSFSFKDRKSSVFLEDAGEYVLSMDGKKLLARQRGDLFLFDSDSKEKTKEKKTVSTKDLMVDRVPAQEWATIFDEVWRRYRDFFYVENMHGYDWKAIGDQYRPLVKHVAHRSDLNYVLGEMIAELSIGHAYIAGGDFEIPDRPKVALPGARFELDEAAGRYRISRIFSGQNEEEKYRAPLTELGVDAKVGDYVLAIDGEELTGKDNPYRLLQHKTNPVTLSLNSEPTLKGARKVTFNPIQSESDLLYLEWIEGNRKKVSEMTAGRVGYLHIPDMGAGGIYEFIKWYYPQIRKEGLIVDVRSNGGGNVSQWIIERLDTKLLGTRFGNFSDKARTYPYSVFHGHMACLLNETSASDGDIFPHRFREAGLGPLIGKRSWGGVVGISGTGPLIDGGSISVPLQGTNGVDGNWIIEGTGVTPDIEVENDPKSVLEGRDPQLERGVQEVLKKMQEKPMKLPSRPADPVKTK
jgi:tricorn protease